MFGEMAADSSMSMAFQQSQGQVLTGTSSSFYNHHHHVFSFQSYPTPRPPPAPTSNATLFLSPPSSTKVPTPSLLHGLPSAPKYKFVTASPADWTPHELKTLKEGLIRYAHEPNIMKYIKIAAMLPTTTHKGYCIKMLVDS